MNDYKELIADLRNPNKVLYETFLNEESKSVESVVAYKAANAIERLVNDYEILAKMYAKVNEDLCVRTKERDAAVADIEEVIHDEFGDICTICNKYKACMKATKKTPLAKLPCERGKWRGVQEDNDEVD